MISSKSTDEGALLKAIVQESASEVLVFDAETLKVVHANPSAVKNLQYKLKEMHKLTPLDFLAPEDGRAFNTLLTLLRSGKKHRTALNAHCRRRDGTRYPIEARVLFTNEAGKSVFICMANDVSQREASRQALAHSESDLRAIVANIPGMAYQVLQKRDGTTSLRYVSEQSAQLLGIKANLLRANPDRFVKLILKEDKPDYQKRLDAAGGVPMSFNWEGRIWMEAWKDVKWVNIRVSRRETEEGLIWDGIMLNVTHSKVAEAEIRRSRFQLSAMTAHIETVKERERQHLAREVHDDLGGNLAAIKIGLSWLKQRLPEGEDLLAQRTAYLDKVVDQTIEAAHRIASNLRPAMLELGIVSAIDWQLQRLAQNADIQYEFNAPDVAIPLSPDATIAVFRIVQEALTNVAKHARATRVRVDLDIDGRHLHVRVADNGRGIQPNRPARKGHGFGLLGMTERAGVLGGQLTVQPARGGGTELSLRIPLLDAEPDSAK